MMVAVKDKVTQHVTADQPLSGGRCTTKARKRRPKKRSMALRLPNSALLQVGGKQERSLSALGLNGMTATAPSVVWIHAITVTADHPFWVDGGDGLIAPGWIAAGNLRLGDVLRTATQIGHNALERITSWTGQIHGPESWAHDGNGNIISNTEFISDAIRTTAFTDSQTTPNQLDQQQTQGLGVEYFTYDQHGDTTSLTSTDPLRYPNGQLDPYHVNIHVGYDAQSRPLTEPPPAVALTTLAWLSCPLW